MVFVINGAVAPVVLHQRTDYAASMRLKAQFSMRLKAQLQAIA
jgi:hypothetical protein